MRKVEEGAKKSEMNDICVNINDAITVTLTEEGVGVLNEYYRGRRQKLIKYHHKGGDIYKFQIWELMAIFGRHMHMGAVQFFKDNEICVLEST